MKINSNSIIRYVFIVLTVGIMIFIFCMSAQNAGQSSNTSKQVIKTIAQIVNSNFNQLSSAEQDEYVKSFQFSVRKLAHFSIYAALGFCICSVLSTYNSLTTWFRCLFSVGGSFLYAVSDEFHQLFVDGRSCEVRDMLIDTSGAFLGTIVSLLVFYFIRRHKKIAEQE